MHWWLPPPLASFTRARLYADLYDNYNVYVQFTANYKVKQRIERCFNIVSINQSGSITMWYDKVVLFFTFIWTLYDKTSHSRVYISNVNTISYQGDNLTITISTVHVSNWVGQGMLWVSPAWPELTFAPMTFQDFLKYWLLQIVCWEQEDSVSNNLLYNINMI